MNSNLSFNNIFKRELKLAAYFIICTTIVVISVSYALFFQVNHNTNNQVVSSGDLAFTYADGTQITSNLKEECFEAMDVATAEAMMAMCSYQFSVQNTGSLSASYQMQLVANNTNTANPSHLKVILRKEVNGVFQKITGFPKAVSSLSDGVIVETNMDFQSAIDVYSIQIFTDEELYEDSDENTTVSYKLVGTGLVHENQGVTSQTPVYAERILNGATPVLEEPLIPVTINEEDGTVKRADITKVWYSYESQKWANAVILKDESLGSTTYASPEVTIPEEAIESYFVWIPRYKYQLFNTESSTYTTNTNNNITNSTRPQTINVVFETRDVHTSVDGWLSHPAFDSFGSNGFWVGKFETGKSSGEDNSINPDGVQIKPNVYSWRGIQPANAFYTTYNYKREMDSHMMKNTEWGAVAYLQHSAYGTRTSVRINNNANYVTGYAKTIEPTCSYTGSNDDCNKFESVAPQVDGTYTWNYNNQNSGVASTTGNKTGVYDMAGGAYEYVMGVMLDVNNNVPVSGRSNANNAGFVGPFSCSTCDSQTATELTTGLAWPDSKYYDTYTYNTSPTDYSRRILGDATGEMGLFGVNNQNKPVSSWYANYADFVNKLTPWFVRGSVFNAGSEAGIFSFNTTNGNAIATISFRLILTP